MDTTLFLAVLGTQEIAIIGIGILVLFGAKRLPELARGMGEGMREFKKAVKEINTDDETPGAPPSPAADKNDVESGSVR